MSAAAPQPPPHRYPVTSLHDNRTQQTDSNGYPDPRNGHGSGNGGAPRPPQPLKHMKDIYARAQHLIPKDASVEKLILTASECLRIAQTSLDFRKPDMALSDFIEAQLIMSQVLPAHRDAPSLNDRPRLAAEHRAILKV